MNKRTLLLALTAAITFSTAAWAQVPPSVSQRQDYIQQEQQRLFNEVFFSGRNLKMKYKS